MTLYAIACVALMLSCHGPDVATPTQTLSRANHHTNRDFEPKLALVSNNSSIRGRPRNRRLTHLRNYEIDNDDDRETEVRFVSAAPSEERELSATSFTSLNRHPQSWKVSSSRQPLSSALALNLEYTQSRTSVVSDHDQRDTKSEKKHVSTVRLWPMGRESSMMGHMRHVNSNGDGNNDDGNQSANQSNPPNESNTSRESDQVIKHRTHQANMVITRKTPGKEQAESCEHQLTMIDRDNVPCRKQLHDAESEFFDDHQFSEYDSQFILHDYRPKLAPGARRRRSLDGLPPSGKISQVQTIYFGGFFPWLADKRSQSYFDGGSNGRIAEFTSGSSLRSDDQHLTASRNQSPKRRRKNKNNEHATGQKDDVIREANDQVTANEDQERQHQSPAQTLSASSMQYPNSETRHQLGKFILPAVRLALDHINTNRSILSAYKLEVVPRDTQVSCLASSDDSLISDPKQC